jgi:iron complex outermembrane receptor protein
LDVAGAAYINHGKLESGVDAAYEFCYSTNLKLSSINDASQGKQLIYEPIHKLNGGVYVGYAGVRLGYRMQLVGMRYTSSDNSSSLPAYTTADATLSYDLQLKSFHANFYLQCKNCWNASYQVLTQRPMPGRSLMVGINLSAHQFPKHD